MFLKNRNISSKIKRSKVTDYAALNDFLYPQYGKNNKKTVRPTQEVLAIRRIFSLVDMITKTKFSNSPNVFKIGVV